MSQKLDIILDQVRKRLIRQRTLVPEAQLRALCRQQPPARPLLPALRRMGKGSAGAVALRIVGELKRRSPSAGEIDASLEVSSAAPALATAGCAALSILTEPDFFGGSLQDLREARAVVELPLLRKDFVVDAYQLLEARAAGADAVLLLAAAHSDSALRELAEQAAEWGLSVLAEAHGEAELERLLRLDFPIVGLNARDLRDFSVDLERILRWLPLVPSDRVVVAESGVRDRLAAQRIAAAGFDALLIGEGLLRGGQPGERFRELFGGP